MWPGFNGLYSWWGSTISDSLILISFKSRQVRKALRKLWRWQRVVWNCKSINDRQTIGWIKHWFTNDYTYNIRLLSTGICYLSRLWLFCVDLLLLLLPIVLKNNLAFLYFDIDRYDEGYSRNASCAPIVISTFLSQQYISLDFKFHITKYLCKTFSNKYNKWENSTANR